jgi:4-amino-4-deoxy-L-arabinose transferase-like glycosyltransferase
MRIDNDMTAVGHSGLVFIVLLGIAFLILLTLHHQPYYPGTWLDEGFVLQGALNLVRYGQYAMRSVEGFRILDQPLVANGPGIVLPITAVFELFGVGLLQARIVAAVYTILTVLVYFMVAKKLYSTPAALLSSFLLLAVPKEGLLWFGRMAVGNVPALFYFLFGYLLWLLSTEHQDIRLAIGAGFCFGLALVTKGQYGLSLIAFLVVIIANEIYYKSVSLVHLGSTFLIAAACLGIWIVLQARIVGWENFDEHMAAIRSSSKVTIFAFNLRRIPGSLNYLIRSGLFLFVGPGLIYAGWSLRKRSLWSLQILLPITFVVMWLSWYLIASIGWHRYVFAPYAVGLLFSGRFILDLFAMTVGIKDSQFYESTMTTARRLGIYLLFVASAIGSVWSMSGHITSVVARPDRSAQEFAGQLLQSVESDVIVESFEWQLDILADLKYHHPNNTWVDMWTATSQLGKIADAAYDPLVYNPDYLIDGPWSKQFGVYSAVLGEGCCALLYSVGSYDLYQVGITD